MFGALFTQIISALRIKTLVSNIKKQFIKTN